MIPLTGLLLAAATAGGAAVDGNAALRHASALASLGPHPWGSPRARAAAAYVAAQLRGAGLSDVRPEEFEVKGVRGVNVVAVLKGAGPGIVVVGAHHDTAPDAPGAYDDGGGVGVMIEVARVMARRPPPPRTIVFASWDGEEAWSTGVGTTTGSRAYVRSLGPQAREVVAAFVVEMSGWSGGTPVLHPVAYADPLRPGRAVIAPAWLVAAALSGARGAGAPLGVGDPWLSWLYQPAVRTFRVNHYGDDLSFLQAGVPAVFTSDSSFSAFYPWYHAAGDTADRLDAAALGRMGEAVRGAVDEIARAPIRRDADADWFSALGRVASRWILLLAGVAALLPGLVHGWGSGGRRFLARAGLSALFAVLVWVDPLPALWILGLPVLVTGLSSRRPAWGLSLLPAVALIGLGAAAWARGFAHGTWLPLWYRGALVAALLLSAVPAVSAAPGRSVRNGARLGGRSARRGLSRVRAAS
ncbi:MAG TPA: M28 family metallopeptidase [Vicinamibacteria bacterium]